MEKLLQEITNRYPQQVSQIEQIKPTEINITLNDNTDIASFSQELQDHIIALIDELTILKVNLLSANGTIRDSFSTNQ